MWKEKRKDGVNELQEVNFILQFDRGKQGKKAEKLQGCAPALVVGVDPEGSIAGTRNGNVNHFTPIIDQRLQG